MFGKYDDYDYHVAAAIEAGFAPDHGFTHIGFMMSWLIRHGLFRTEFISAETARDLATGKLRSNDLRDVVDGKLVDEMLTPVGSTFLANYYEAYLTEFLDAFPGLPDYAVSDEPANQAIVDRLIDEAFVRWRALGPGAAAR